MTTNDTEAGKPAQAAEPLALRLNDLLGPVPWERLMMLANEYAMHLVDATHHQAESRADIARTAALKTMGKMREAFFAHCREVEQGTRHACSIAVWMTLQEALEPDADDKGLDGWMREAERRVKLGPNEVLGPDQPERDDGRQDTAVEGGTSCGLRTERQGPGCA